MSIYFYVQNYFLTEFENQTTMQTYNILKKDFQIDWDYSTSHPEFMKSK